MSYTRNLFLSIIAYYLYQCPIYNRQNYQTQCDPSERNTYDFIVVGGGSAGVTLASRLSENPNWNILLIEAGGPPSNLTECPATYLAIQGTKEDWAFRTEPAETCKGFTNGQCRWAQGKALGGGSSINAMLGIIGHTKDYDNWAEAGNEGWDWEAMQSYFDRTLTNMRRSTYRSNTPLRGMLTSAATEMGLQINQPGLLGYYDVNVTIWQNQRFNAAKGYLAPANSRSNLCVLTHSQVTEILFEDDDGIPRAIGVVVEDYGGLYFATKEVIVSSGAINSPKLLMLSGVGPRDNLEALGIPVLCDLPVGYNLQDHFLLTTYFTEVPQVPITEQPIQDCTGYCQNRTGPLINIGIGEVSGWINTRKDSTFPDAQIMHIGVPRASELTLPLYLEKFGFNRITQKSFMDINKNATLICFLPVILHPKSRGQVVLSSRNPYDKPLVYSGYLDDENGEDLETMLRVIDFLNRFTNTSPFNGTRLANFDTLYCRDKRFQSREYWTCVLRHYGSTIFHPVGTCKMGPANDPTAVVDPRLRVYGVRGLRVCDSSIMPTIVSCNTNIPTITIGEHGAAIIFEDYGNPD